MAKAVAIAQLSQAWIRSGAITHVVEYRRTITSLDDTECSAPCILDKMWDNNHGRDETYDHASAVRDLTSAFASALVNVDTPQMRIQVHLEGATEDETEESRSAFEQGRSGWSEVQDREDTDLEFGCSPGPYDPDVVYTYR